MTAGSALTLTAYILARKGIAAVKTEWLERSANYGGRAWEVGIVIGVMMGVFLLKEPFGGGRLLGSGFIVGGLLLITLLL